MNEDLLEKVLRKRKPAFTIQIGLTDNKEDESKALAPEVKDADEETQVDQQDGDESKDVALDKAAYDEASKLKAILGEDLKGHGEDSSEDDEQEQMPGGRKPTLGELARMKMRKRLKSIASKE